MDEFINLGDNRQVRPREIEAITIEDLNYTPPGHNYLATQFRFEVRVYLTSGAILDWKFPYGKGETLSYPKPNKKRMEKVFKEAKKFQKELLGKVSQAEE